jgi:MarR-like DNA-binding transcriptional regulator SgrR of sgrS sRNA
VSSRLAVLEEALDENARLMETLLRQQQYDDALQCMDDRLVLIDKLVTLASGDAAEQQAVAALAVRLSVQEEAMKNLAATHHHAIFEQLTLFGRASKAGQAYRVNSKEF